MWILNSLNEWQYDEHGWFKKKIYKFFVSSFSNSSQFNTSFYHPPPQPVKPPVPSILPLTSLLSPSPSVPPPTVSTPPPPVYPAPLAGGGGGV